MSDTLALTDATVVARLATDEATARHVADMLAESLDPSETVTTSFEETEGRWAIAIHFREPPNEAAVRALVALAADESLADTLVFETVQGKDWVKASLEGLSPVAAGRFLVHGSHDRARVRPNQIGIEIEAALAFGTGHHGTTRGCLLALDGVLKTRRPTTVFDVGTGTGVLAIAAAKALRRPVLASDIDRQAVRTARENAWLNRAGALVEVVHAAGVDAHTIRARGPFDLVFANILAGPLRRFAAPLSRLVAPNGTLVLSGLLPAHASGVLSSYRSQSLRAERCIALDGWVTIVMRR